MQKTVFLLLMPLFLLFSFSGCDNLEQGGKKTIKITSSSCKQFTESIPTDTIEQDMDCALFTYSADNKTLRIKHINAAFNCCPDKIFGEISIDSNLIVITEKEKLTNPCKCNCLYDLDYEIPDILPQTYRILIIEAYLNDTDEKLETVLELDKVSEAQLCKKRTSYPWIF